MPIKYLHAPDIQQIAEEVVERLSWNHILLEHVAFIRSIGSKSPGTIARCHALGKAMQIGMKRDKSFYLIEVISKRFDNLPVEEQLKVIIHELMHIPNTFGGGFKHHNVVNDTNVEKVYQHYTMLKKKSEEKPEENFGEKKGWF